MVSAVALLIGIVVYSDISNDLSQTLGQSVLISNGTAGGIITTDIAYACDTPTIGGNEIHLINKSTGAIISSNTLSISGISSEGCLGLAQDPTDLTWYAIIQSGGDRYLSTIDPSTGLGTSLGDTGDKVNSITIKPDGTLYASIGTGGTDNDSLNTLNKSTGALTKVCEFPVSSGLKNVFGYDFTNDIFYRVSGESFAGMLLEEVTNESTCAVSTIPITGDVPFLGQLNFEFQDFEWHTGDGLFYVLTKDNGGGDTDYSSLTLGGVMTFISDNVSSEAWKGLAFEVTVGAGSPPVYGTQIPNEFAQANSIALTVLGVMPVALFFTIFTILSPKVDGE